MNKLWTYEEEQQLLDMRYENIALEEVALVLGRSIDSCRKKHWRLLHEAHTPQWYKKIEEHERTL